MNHFRRIYAGTYSRPILFGTGEVLEGKGRGIYRLLLDLDTGELRHEGEPVEADNPSYLCLSPDGNFLYSVNELKEYQGQPGGGVSAYRIRREDGSLDFLGSRPTLGTDPCHVSVNSGGTHVFVSNFMSGSVCVYPVMADGSLAPHSQLIQHQGSSVDPARHKGPHAHSLILSPDERFAFVPDLGTDHLAAYRTDFERSLLSPSADFCALPGSGPRFCEFHRNGRFCYLINELSSTISLLYYDGNGGFTLKQTVDTVPQGCKTGNICADLHLTPDGRFLYGSNRGHDSLSVYRVDPDSGTLSWLDNIPCGGRTPRNFAVDPAGRYLIVANQDSDNILTFHIDPSDGSLTRAWELACPTPVCVKPVRS